MILFISIICILFLNTTYSLGQDADKSSAEIHTLINFGEIRTSRVSGYSAVFNCYTGPSDVAVHFRISFPASDVIKVEISADEFSDLSWRAILFDHDEQDSFHLFKTDSMWVRVEKTSWRLSVFYPGGKQIYGEKNEYSGFHIEGNNRDIIVTAEKGIDAFYYGFGEKFNGLNQSGKSIKIELSDAFASADDRTYKSIPFFLSSEGYGLFVNSSERGVFNMGEENNEHYSFRFPGNELEYYIFTSNNPLKIISQYTSITGRIPLIPRWSLEPWLSRRTMTGWYRGLTAENDIDMMIDHGYRLGVILWEGIDRLFNAGQGPHLHYLFDKWEEFLHSNNGFYFDVVNNQTFIKVRNLDGSTSYNVRILDIGYNENYFSEACISVPPTPTLTKVQGWDQSADISFSPLVDAESYLVRYWTKSGTLKKKVQVFETPVTIEGLKNGKKYFVEMASVAGGLISAPSPVISVKPQKRIALFEFSEGSGFINAGHFLSMTDTMEGENRKYTYGIYSSEDTTYTLWLKSRRNTSHHHYFRWYRIGDITIRKGENYIGVNLRDGGTEIQRLYLTLGEQRPYIRDEEEASFIRRKKIKITDTVTINF